MIVICTLLFLLVHVSWKKIENEFEKTTIEIRCDFSLFRDIVKNYNEYSRNILVRLLINIIKENLIVE